MGGYIRMDKDLKEDPRVEDLSKALVKLLPEFIRNASPEQLEAFCGDAVLGGLFKLWRHGDTYLGRHNRLKGALHGAARISEVTALPASLMESFPQEWLRFHPNGSVELPDYAEKNTLINRDRRREKGRERQRRYRERKRNEDLECDALHGVTNGASQRHQSVTTGTGTGTGTGTETSETGTGTETSAALAAGPDGAAAPRKPWDEEYRDRFGADPIPVAAGGKK